VLRSLQQVLRWSERRRRVRSKEGDQGRDIYLRIGLGVGTEKRSREGRKQCIDKKPFRGGRGEY